MSAPFNDRGPFAVGEICRIVRCDTFPELIGVEVRITKLPRVMRRSDGRVWTGYGTDLMHKGYYISPSEEYLRRRPPSNSHERTYMAKWRDMAGKAPQRQGEVA